jgi:hypothetical protein
VKGRERVPATHTVSTASIVSWFSIPTSKGHPAVSGHGEEKRPGPPHAMDLFLPRRHRGKGP